MNSGRILVNGSDIYIGGSSSEKIQIARVDQIPQVTQYVHPAEKQCNYVYTHPSEIQCNAASEINSLKSSVSNGKSAIASAITGKGVSTASDATFQTMANNINSIQSRNSFDLKVDSEFGTSPYALAYSFGPNTYSFMNGMTIRLVRGTNYNISEFTVTDFSGTGNRGSLECYGSNAQGVVLEFGLMCDTRTALWSISNPVLSAVFWGLYPDNIGNIIQYTQTLVEQTQNKLNIQLTCKMTDMSEGNAGSNCSIQFIKSNKQVDTLTINFVWNNPNFEISYGGRRFYFYM